MLTLTIDLYELPSEQLTAALTDDLEVAFFSRCPPEERPKSLLHKLPDPAREHSSNSSGLVDEEKGDAGKDVRREKNYSKHTLLLALHSTLMVRWWTSGVLRLIAGMHVLFLHPYILRLIETLRTTTPLVNKVLLTWLVQSYAYHRVPAAQRQELGLTAPRGIGFGIGLAFAVFSMQRMSDSRCIRRKL